VLVLSFDGQGPSDGAVDSIARETGIPWHITPLHIDQQGAHVQQGGLGVHPPVSARREPPQDQVPGPGAGRMGGSRRDRASFLRDTQTAVEGMPCALLVLS